MTSRSVVIGGPDLSSLPCLQRKRVLAFFNHFVSRTAEALSSMEEECEKRWEVDYITNFSHFVEISKLSEIRVYYLGTI